MWKYCKRHLSNDSSEVGKYVCSVATKSTLRAGASMPRDRVRSGRRTTIAPRTWDISSPRSSPPYA